MHIKIVLQTGLHWVKVQSHDNIYILIIFRSIRDSLRDDMSALFLIVDFVSQQATTRTYNDNNPWRKIKPLHHIALKVLCA